MMRGILAQAVVDVPMSDTTKTLAGLIGVMVLIITVLTCVILIKKVFGRTPPLDAEFKKLRSEFYEKTGSVKKELNHRLDGVEQDIEEIKLDRERKWQELRNEYHALEMQFAKLTGRIEAVLKKIEAE